jgi:hypothetical protein
VTLGTRSEWRSTNLFLSVNKNPNYETNRTTSEIDILLKQVHRRVASGRIESNIVFGILVHQQMKILFTISAVGEKLVTVDSTFYHSKSSLLATQHQISDVNNLILELNTDSPGTTTVKPLTQRFRNGETVDSTVSHPIITAVMCIGSPNVPFTKYEELVVCKVCFGS